MPIPNDSPPPLLEIRTDVIKPSQGQLEWACADPLDPAASAALPTAPGVYCWATRRNGGVHYTGRAIGQYGLWGRLGRDEMRWVRTGTRSVEEEGTDATYMADNWESFSRVMVTVDAVVWWATASSVDEAKAWERRLLQQAIRLTGVVPPVNGGAWWNRSQDWVEARAWAHQAGGDVQFGPGIGYVSGTAAAIA